MQVLPQASSASPASARPACLGNDSTHLLPLIIQTKEREEMCGVQTRHLTHFSEGLREHGEERNMFTDTHVLES